jgi:hypothetical protein
MPCLWSAWLELAPMLDANDKFSVLDRIHDSHWMKNFFIASFYLDAHQERESISLSNTLLKTF